MVIIHKKKWLEVALEVDNELAEAVAEVLARFAVNGVVIETAIRSNPSMGDVEMAKNVRVCAYLPVDKKLEATKGKIQEALWHLGFIRPLPDAQFKLIEEQNWAEAWKENYQPILIGKKIIVVPAWMESSEPDRIAIKIEPGMAFGTGTHPTTQLCITMMEDWFDDRRSMFASSDVIDIGCGSGILSIAAKKFGAKNVLGVDLDDLAIKAAKENAKLNGFNLELELGLGSVSEIIGEKFSLQQAQLVLANILATVIINLLEQGLDKVISPNGTLILSGILSEQVDEVIRALEGCQLRVIRKQQMGDWVALSAGR